MDCNLTELQLEVRELFARFFDRECSLEQVRAAEPLGFDAQLWRRMLDTGVVGMGLPEDVGGGGAGLGELVHIAELYGKHLAPIPLIEAVTAARATARSQAVRSSTWLNTMMSGERLVSLALRPASGQLCDLVPAGAIADAVLALHGDDLVLADVVGERPALRNLGSSPLANCTLETRPLVVARGPDAFVEFEAALDDWRVLTASALVGLSREAIHITTEYVKVREAFGRPIASFQTVAHRLADETVQLDGAWLLCLEAAWAIDEGLPDGRRLGSMAFAYSSEVSARCASDAVHLHGGVGLTVEHDAQLFFRRAKAWPLALGDPSHELQHLADQLFGPVER